MRQLTSVVRVMMNLTFLVTVASWRACMYHAPPISSWCLHGVIVLVPVGPLVRHTCVEDAEIALVCDGHLSSIVLH